MARTITALTTSSPNPALTTRRAGCRSQQPTRALVAVGVPPRGPHPIVGLWAGRPVQHGRLEGEVQRGAQCAQDGFGALDQIIGEDDDGGAAVGGGGVGSGGLNLCNNTLKSQLSTQQRSHTRNPPTHPTRPSPFPPTHSAHPSALISL